MFSSAVSQLQWALPAQLAPSSSPMAPVPRTTNQTVDSSQTAGLHHFPATTRRSVSWTPYGSALGAIQARCPLTAHGTSPDSCNEQMARVAVSGVIWRRKPCAVDIALSPCRWAWLSGEEEHITICPWDTSCTLAACDIGQSLFALLCYSLTCCSSSGTLGFSCSPLTVAMEWSVTLSLALAFGMCQLQAMNTRRRRAPHGLDVIQPPCGARYSAAPV